MKTCSVFFITHRLRVMNRENRSAVSAFSIYKGLAQQKLIGQVGHGTKKAILLNNYTYYSTIMSFYHIRSREQAKYEAVIHCSVLV